MGLFSKKPPKYDGSAAIAVLEKYSRKELDNAQFLKEFAKQKILYSTPAGDHKDGGKKMFVIGGPDGSYYLPIFVSEESMKEWCDLVGRVGYMMIETEFHSIVETTRNVNKTNEIKLGVIVDPMKHQLTMDVSMLDAIIEMMNA